jgi:geranylgeranyl diphosphate synthase type I
MKLSFILQSLESELQRQIARLEGLSAFHEMLTYHMGWSGDGAGAQAQGKRIRPLLLLLTVSACGGNGRRRCP